MLGHKGSLTATTTVLHLCNTEDFFSCQFRAVSNGLLEALINFLAHVAIENILDQHTPVSHWRLSDLDTLPMFSKEQRNPRVPHF